MTLLDKMRRAFGFVHDDETEIFTDDPPSDPADKSVPADKPDLSDLSDISVPADSSGQYTEPSTDDSVTALASAMLAEVVGLFNSFQPEFIARCLDPDRQQTLLAESLTPALRSALAEMADRERQRIANAAEKERASLDARLKQLTERNEELERRRAEFKDEQLSASRQKRALKERVNDLERQIEKIEGEKEQLELENRSMLNKLRAAAVAETAAQEAPPSPGSPTTTDTEALETARAETARELEASKAEAAKAAENAEALTRDLESARAEAAGTAEKLAAAEADRDEYRRQVELLQGIAEQAEKFADTVEKRDARIAELKARLKDTENDRKEIDRLAAENRSLRSTIEANLYEHATEMSALRRQMEDSKPRRGRPRKPRPEPVDTTAADALTADDKPKKTSSRQSRITAIDEFIESNEWLMAPSPEELAAKAEEPSPDFGYHAPAHKATIHDDDSQLTLF